MRDERVNWFSKLVTVLAYTFILAPMIIIVIISFNSGEAIQFPPSGVSLLSLIHISFESMGTNTLTVSIMGRGSKTMPYDDMQQLVDDNIDTFEYVSPNVTVNGVAKVGTETLDTTSITVSYTHLDVYKRQQECCSILTQF